MYSKKYFIGNWKMHGVKKDISHLKKIEKFIKTFETHKISSIFCVPYTILGASTSAVNSKYVKIGSQDISHQSENFGPFTGSVSSKMVKDLNCTHVILGHSEKRADGDNDKNISKKIDLALKNSLHVILCVGESIEDYKRKKSFDVVKKQINKAFLNKKNLKKIIIAYEPVWSIGTGIVPNSKYLDKFFDRLNKYINKKFKINIPLLYGGSVSKNNVIYLKKIKSCRGFLIGGSSLKSKDYIDIIKKYYN